jgi:hypothetical protein
MAEIEGMGYRFYREGDYSVRLTMARIDGRPEVVGVEMWGIDPNSPEIPPSWRQRDTPGFWPEDAEPTAITSTELRLPLGRMFEDWRKETISTATHIIEQGDHEPDTDIQPWSKWRPEAEAVLETTTAKTRAGRPKKWGDDHYREVAAVYTKAIRNGEASAKTVARRWDLPLPEGTRTAVKWISRARQLGHLPPTRRGRASVPTSSE